MKNFYNLLKRSSKKLLFMMILLSAAGYANAQLTISKDGTETAAPGDRISYRLIYQNTGTTIQTNVVIIDTVTVFDGEYLGSSPAGVYNSTTREVKWTKDQIPQLASLNAGTGVIIYMYGTAGKTFNDATHYPGGRYLATSPAYVTNKAYIYSDQFPTKVVSNTVSTTLTQTCTTTLSVANGVVKSASNSEIKYVVSVLNTGNVWNKWTLSAQNLPGYQALTASFEDMQGNPLNGNQTVWVAPGLSTQVIMKIVSITGTNPSIGTNHQPNMTRVTATPVACGDPVYQDYLTEICGGQCPEYLFVSTNKIDVPDPVQSGDTLTYQLIMYNAYTNNQGVGQAVPNITMTETYPTGVSYISNTSPLNNGNPVSVTQTGNNKWLFPSVPPGLTTFYIKVKVANNTINNTSITNRVDLFSPAYNGGTAPFDTWYESTLIKSAHDLWVRKTANKTYAETGDYVTYKLVFGNKGNFQGDDVTLVDNYDEIYMDVISQGGATVSGGNLTWTFPGAMMPGYKDSVTYTLQIKPTATFPVGTTSIANNVNIRNNRFPVIAYDKDFSDNEQTYQVYVATLPDLTISKTANPSPVSAAISPGATVTYTIIVNNIGDANHTGQYNLIDYLPAGVSYISSTKHDGTPGGTYNSTNHTVTWTQNNALPRNIPLTFTVTVGGITFNMGGSTLSNKATIYSATLNDKNLANNEVTVLVPLIYPNYWLGNISTDWAVAGNWTYGIPGTGSGADLIDDDVIFATTANYTSAAQNNLILDQDRQIGKLINASDKALIIPTTRTLKVNETATNNAPERLVIRSVRDQANGALIFNNPASNSSVQATVEFASKSKPGTGTWPRVWQFFGTPVKNKTLPDLFGTTIQGSIYGGDPAINTIVRKYEEYWNDPQSPQEKWRDVTLSEVLPPYLGYEITQPQTVFDAGIPYSFKGTLITDNDFTLVRNISAAGVYSRGNYILANPYAAPIFISKMLPADFVNLAQTIYIYNTGSRQQWIDANGYSTVGDQPGTYTAIPINAATTIGKTQIPSMQAFMVKASAETPAPSFRFRYETVYRGAITDLNEPMRIKRAEAPADTDIKPLLTMDVIGETGSDRVYLITAEGTGKSYDAGWDGFKTLSTDNVQLYAMDADNKRMQVNTDNDLNDTYIGFRTGGESTYTLRFRFNNEMQGVYQSLYVQDLATGIIQQITDGMMMTFVSTAGTAEKRFRISGSKIITGINNALTGDDISLMYTSSSIIVKNNSGSDVQVTVFNLVGQPLQTEKIPAGTKSFSHQLMKGTYVIEAKSLNNSSKTILKAIIN